VSPEEPEFSLEKSWAAQMRVVKPYQAGQVSVLPEEAVDLTPLRKFLRARAKQSLEGSEFGVESGFVKREGCQRFTHAYWV